ncbi:hypothetical protein ACRYCC_12395 [Actinomadura scrupuli]|uniref:hypothetical protein n=1 Tax=Actinomadura scrupuli TaxID=559629 RepID=UPI003D9882D5
MGSEDRRRLLAGIGAALGLAGPYPESLPSAGEGTSPGRRVLAGTEDGAGRFGWIEETTETDHRSSPPIEFTINVAGGGARRWRTGLYTYAPYFGCHVHLIRFFGDALVVVYTDKHGPLVARAVPATGERRTTGIGRVFAISGELLVHTDDFEDLVHPLRLADLAPEVPLPMAPPPEPPHRAKLEVRDGTVRWTDRVPGPAGEPAGREWRVRRSVSLRLPGPAQRGLPADREALWARLRELLHDADAPQDGPDILIATAGLPFWSPRRNLAAGRNGSGPPIWWFAAAYHLSLRELSLRELSLREQGSPGGTDAARWRAWLERVGTGSGAVPPGWDPAWTAREGTARLALAHIRVRAAQLARACHDGGLPARYWPYGHSKGAWRHPVPLAEFPEAFARAWERVPPGLFPGAASSAGPGQAPSL